LQSRQNAVADGDGLLHPIPIYPIYFLGEGLPDIRGHGAVKVSRTCYDIFTKEVITTKDNFVENLTHDALMICANELRGEEQTNLEKLLSIFRLAAQFKLQHFLTVSEEDYPEQYRPVIRRLQKAAETASVRRLMDDEEDYYMEWVSIERKLDIAVAQVQAERAAKESAEAEAQSERAAKEAAEAQVKSAEAQAQADRAAKEAAEEAKKSADAQAEALLRTLVRTGLDMGLNTAEIAQKFNLPLEAVERIVNFL
jgi:chemotaxis protein histidine kinase CheA